MIESDGKMMKGSRWSGVVHWADVGLFQSAKPPHTAPRDCMAKRRWNPAEFGYLGLAQDRHAKKIAQS
jgi:hypothetical protein